MARVDAARSGTMGMRAKPSSAMMERLVDTDSNAFASVAICYDKYSLEKYLATNAMRHRLPALHTEDMVNYARSLWWNNGF